MSSQIHFDYNVYIQRDLKIEYKDYLIPVKNMTIHHPYILFSVTRDYIRNNDDLIRYYGYYKGYVNPGKLTKTMTGKILVAYVWLKKNNLLHENKTPQESS